MYKIIGTDAKEYGPASIEQIRQWLSAGRLNAQTKAQAEGSVEWRPLAELPEFAELLKGGVIAPPMPPRAPARASRTSGMAIASLVLGILGLLTFGVTALVGLPLGIVSLVKIRGSNGALGGWGLALAGSITCGVMLLLAPVFAALLLLPALGSAKTNAQGIMCMNNMKQLALGAIMYADDNNNQLPSGKNWCDTVQKYVGSGQAFVFLCPGGDQNGRCHYALNARLSGIELSKVADRAQTVLLFESDGGWNVSGGPELLLKKSRHGRAIGLVFADGHAELALEPRLEGVRWEP
ncbi:MAG: DUF4190 domain-containing protein [Verrucomicrobiota bacterium]